MQKSFKKGDECWFLDGEFCDGKPVQGVIDRALDHYVEIIYMGNVEYRHYEMVFHSSEEAEAFKKEKKASDRRSQLFQARQSIRSYNRLAEEDGTNRRAKLVVFSTIKKK